MRHRKKAGKWGEGSLFTVSRYRPYGQGAGTLEIGEIKMGTKGKSARTKTREGRRVRTWGCDSAEKEIRPSGKKLRASDCYIAKEGRQ